jgi:ankyrin repeat protein
MKNGYKQGMFKIAAVVLISMSGSALSAITYTNDDLLRVAGTGDIDAMRAIIASGVDVNAKDADHKGATALIYSAVSAEPEEMKILLAAGADIDEKDDEGMTALMWAARYNEISVVQFLLRQDPPANVNAKNDKNETALYFAARFNFTDMASELMAAGANPNVKDALSKKTALDWARINGNTKLEQMLMDAHAKSGAELR